MKNIKRSGLALMIASCVMAMAGGTAQAQSASGAVAGRGKPGTQVVISNPATGFSRSVSVGSDGNYRFTQLPVGDYRIRVAEEGQEIAVSVSLGGTTTVNLTGSEAALDTVQVVGSRIINQVDVHSTEVSTNMTREDLARLPVAQSLTAVAMLAPGVIAGNASFGGISFGGSSVAENSVFVNGLNVTDFYRRQSFSSAPYAFFGEFQVKTGGYSVEFGRSTGGVINAVTRSGSNEFHGGVEFTWQPEWGREAARDRFYADGTLNVRSSHDRSSSLKSNIWASGPIVKDRLFFFAMYEDRDNRSYFTNSAGTTFSKSRNTGNGFWGTKLDWNISDNHQLALLAFSDDSNSTTTIWDSYDFDTRTHSDSAIDRTSESGGLNWSATYTGHFGENFTARALYGVNESQSRTRTALDTACDWVNYNNATYGATYRAMGSPKLGCHPGNSVVNHEDQRKVMRLDFEWALGNHLLRFGMDREVMTTDRTQFYPGSGVLYTAYGTSPGSVLDNGAEVPAGVNAILMARLRRDGGVFETTANAWYIEDVWNVTQNLLLNIGVRVDSFNNKTASGQSFIKMDNLVSPRLGFSWDMKGDGSSKLFGNLGRYYLPVTNNINYTFAGGLTDERTFHVLEGWEEKTNPVTGASYMAPIIGAQIGGVDTTYNVSVADLRQNVDKDLDAVHQDELILGYQSMLAKLGPAWSWGVNASYRRMSNALDDVRINALCGVRHGNLWPIANPGEKLTLWGTTAMGCAEDGWVTIDTSREGYMKGGSNEIVGYSKPKRTYRSVELQLDRAWDGKWSFNASYLWSKSTGNHEGPVNSDTGYGDTGMVQHWDHPANNERYGVLFNDRRHQLKLRAAYALNDAWSLGGNLVVQSGGPITAFGVTWPDDSNGAASFVTEGSGGGSGWICQGTASECANWQTRQLVYTERGAFDRLPWTWTLGANLNWRKQLANSELKASLSVFNLTNNQRVVNVHSRYESSPGVYRTTFAQGTGWQSPRYTQLSVGWSF